MTKIEIKVNGNKVKHEYRENFNITSDIFVIIENAIIKIFNDLKDAEQNGGK